MITIWVRYAEPFSAPIFFRECESVWIRPRLLRRTRPHNLMDVAIQALAAPILTINQPRPPAVTQNVYESSIQRRARHNGRVPAGEKYRWLASVDFQCQRTSRTLVASPRAATLTVSRHHISCSEEKSYRIPSHQQSAVFLRFHFLFIEFGSITNSQCTKVNPYSALRCSCLPSKSYLI